MFDHLDDDAFQPDHTFRERVHAQAMTRRRRRRRAVAATLAIVGPLALGAGGVLYLRAQANQLERVPVGGLVPATAPSTEPATTDGAADAVVATTAAAPVEGPIHILVVGVDARAPSDPDADVVAGRRADAIALVRLDPIARRIAVVSVPRDLWVDPDGSGAGGTRINALAGDPTELVVTVSDVLGVDINHYVEIDFAGFRRLVDLAGGVEVPFDAPMRDRQTGFTAEPGCQRLDGDAALAYVRSRRMERYDTDTQVWEPDPTSDLGRIARQQDFVQRMVGAVLTEGYSSADEARIVTDVLDDVTIDTGLTLGSLRSLFATAQLIGADDLETFTLTSAVSAATIDGQSVLRLDERQTARVMSAFLGTPGDADDGDVSLPPAAAITPAPATACS